MRPGRGRGEAAHRAAVLHLAPWFALSPTLVLIGGFAGDDVRIVLWVAAVAVDVAGTLREREGSGWQISPAHFAERYALFIIIALGESIVAVGAGLAGHTKNAAFAAALAVSFVGVAAIWWAYFDWVSIVAEQRMRQTTGTQQATLARDLYSYLHFPMVAGIVLFAVSVKKTLDHVDAQMDAARAGRRA